MNAVAVVRICASVTALVERSASAQVPLAEPMDARGRAVGPLLRDLRDCALYVPLIAYVDLTPESVRALSEFLDAPLYGVVSRGVDDDAHHRRSAVERALQVTCELHLLDHLATHIPLEQQPFLEARIAAVGRAATARENLPRFALPCAHCTTSFRGRALPVRSWSCRSTPSKRARARV